LDTLALPASLEFVVVIGSSFSAEERRKNRRAPEDASPHPLSAQASARPALRGG